MSRSQRWEPMKPAPPVTRIPPKLSPFLDLDDSSRGRLQPLRFVPRVHQDTASVDDARIVQVRMVRDDDGAIAALQEVVRERSRSESPVIQGNLGNVGIVVAHLRSLVLKELDDV